MRRRDLIKGIAGSAIAWPLAARAQQPERMRRVGILMGGSNDPLGQGRAAALVQGLGEFNWHDGGNLNERYAAELIALDPEVLVVWGQPGCRCVAAANQHDPDRLKCHQPGWPRLCREPGAPRRQYHRLHGLTTRRWPANGCGC